MTAAAATFEPHHDRRFPKLAPAGAEGTQIRASGSTATAELAECTCPDFCERDHGNE